MTRLFRDQADPRIYATPLGVDFCQALVDGLNRALAGQPPEAIARVEVWVANARMQRRLQTLYLKRGPGFLPRIRPVAALSEEADLAGIPPATSPLRQRLELAALVSDLMERFEDLAPRSALYDLSDGLADLMGEMLEEGVTPADLAVIDVAGYASHWQRAQALLGVITQYLGDGQSLPREARLSLIVDHLTKTWTEAPPSHPILVAGSTGSRGATSRFMQAVARLPQGAVVLPGIDRDMPPAIWRGLLQGRRDGLAGEDHPQYRLAKFAEEMGVPPWDIPDWPGGQAGLPERTALVSLALRPAPVTDQWRVEGPKLERLDTAMAGVTLLEAPSPQMEAATIALRLREAVENGQTGALISPDRGLTRRVAAALARWKIRPDDSAGAPLALTAPGRFLRHVAALDAGPTEAEALLVLLKHPICHSAADRNEHLRRTRDLERQVLRKWPAPPTRARLVAWAEARKDDPGAMAWVTWISAQFLSAPLTGSMPLLRRVAHHQARAEAIARGSLTEDTGTGELYEKEAGEAALSLLAELTREAEVAGDMSARDYAAFFTALTEDREARTALFPHADVLIWGTQEARVQGADLIICAGLNEGIWPAAPKADPWLNRAMRASLGLRLPDRVIGLSAHDFQQALAANSVWLTRARRDDEAETVPSRWLNRLVNLLEGSGEVAVAALGDARARGDRYLAMAERLVTPDETLPPEPRPSPAPPADARPTRLSVTQVETLIRDPYALYAQKVLGLARLSPLRMPADARLRGSVVHDVMERFVTATKSHLPPLDEAMALLSTLAEEGLTPEEAPWPIARRLWRAQIARVGPFFFETELERRRRGKPLSQEIKGEWLVADTGVTLSAMADRIDQMPDGCFAIYDYKTGKPPTEKEEKSFTKQLWLEALMVEAGAFGLPAGRRVAHIAYIGLGSSPKIVAHDIDPKELAQIAGEFRGRLLHMRCDDTGFPSRRRVKSTRFPGDFDQLARYGEWDETQDAVLIPVGRS